MSARHGEWQLLEHDSDPVPGDPDQVGDEATHYATVARTISSQAARLRRLAESDDDLKGHYADELRDGMRELADDLDRIHGRFEVVGTQLAVLEPTLRTARTRTGAALEDAVEAQRTIAANTPVDTPMGPQVEPPTQAEQDAEKERDRQHGAGESALTRARTACGTAMSDFEAVADAAVDARLAGRSVVYSTAAPDDERRWLVVAFSTPGDGNPDSEFSGLMVELFDAMMSTWRWDDAS